MNKDEGLEKNVKIISDVLKEYGQNNKINVIIVESFDTEEKEITAEKIEEELKKNLDVKENQESNFNLIKLNQDYNNEFLENSHLLKLIEQFYMKYYYLNKLNEENKVIKLIY